MSNLETAAVLFVGVFVVGPLLAECVHYFAHGCKWRRR